MGVESRLRACGKVQTQPGGNVPYVERKRRDSSVFSLPVIQGLALFLSLLWSVPSGLTISAELLQFFPGAPHAIIPSFQPN